MKEVNISTLIVLSEIKKNSSISQRMLSKLSGFSLGKVNALLKEYIEQGYIETKQVKNRSQYILTDLGINILEDLIIKTTNTKIDVNEESEVKVKNAVILAAGKREDFDIPVGLLELGSTTLIERTISILEKNEINKIYMLIGYKGDEYKKALSHKENIEFIESEEYATSGTMNTLSKLHGHINEDFILIESDLVYDESAIKSLVENKNRDCMLIAPLSGVGDETFVEIRNEYVYKISKDIHQFKKVDGEFVGITKISKGLFSLMMDEYKDTENQYINYEYNLMDVARTYNISFINLKNLIWGEIDNINQYEVITNKYV